MKGKGQRIEGLEWAVRDLSAKLAKLEQQAAGRAAAEKCPAVKFKRLFKGAIVPAYQTAGAAAMDLYAYCMRDGASADKQVIEPCKRGVVRTGLAVELPPGYEMQIRSRSGLAVSGITVANSPGTIDEDYRGEIDVILRNENGLPFTINHGDRVAQAVVARVVQADVLTAAELAPTARGAGGLGSTGVGLAVTKLRCDFCGRPTMGASSGALCNCSNGDTCGCVHKWTSHDAYGCLIPDCECEVGDHRPGGRK